MNEPADGDAESDPGVGSEGGFDVESLWQACEQPGAPPGPDPLLGQTIGGVRLGRVLADGGMGRVYEGEQENPRRPAAVKVVRPGLLSQEAVRRFLRETRLLGGLQHPWICQVYSAGTFTIAGADLPFFVMEYVPKARPITDYVRDEKLPVPRILELFRHVCDAVAHAHARGIVHRDLKPSNVLIDGNGLPKLIDFGIARGDDGSGSVTTSTPVGRILGTLQYSSPEQAAGEPGDVDQRSDVYALGVMLYELLAGRLPYDIKGRPLLEAIRIIHSEHPTPVRSLNDAVPPRISAIVDACLEKEPERRFADAAALASAIGDGRTWPSRRPLARLRPAALLGLAALGLAIAAVAAGWRTGDSSSGNAAWLERLTAPLRGGSAAATTTASQSPVDGQRPGHVNQKLRSLSSRARAAAGPIPPTAGTEPSAAEDPAPSFGPALVNSVGMQLRWIPGGTFLMGQSDGEADEIPHEVTISEAYWLGIHEVTSGQWRRVMGGTEQDRPDDDVAISGVSWEAAVEFCRRLSELPEERTGGRRYRLPTEAEWEFACRAGTMTYYSFGVDEADLLRHAWFCDNSGREILDTENLWSEGSDAYAKKLAENGCGPHPVGQLPPNPWGLHDMHGNVWEWCSDWYGDYPRSSVTDPGGPEAGKNRVHRGGSWFNGLHDVRSARRFASDPQSKRPVIGLRVAMNGPQPPVQSDSGSTTAGSGQAARGRE